MPRLTYNAPFTLTFALLAAGLFLLDLPLEGWLRGRVLSIAPGLPLSDPLTYPRLFLHVLGHGSFLHLVTNLTIILLVGPMLEEKHGAARLLALSTATALLSGLLVLFVMPQGLLGASGVGFMLIILSSFARAERGTIPLTFVLVATLFLGQEIVRMQASDTISQTAHLLGGACGAAFGFWLGNRRGDD